MRFEQPLKGTNSMQFARRMNIQACFLPTDKRGGHPAPCWVPCGGFDQQGRPTCGHTDKGQGLRWSPKNSRKLFTWTYQRKHILWSTSFIKEAVRLNILNATNSAQYSAVYHKPRFQLQFLVSIQMILDSRHFSGAALQAVINTWHWAWWTLDSGRVLWTHCIAVLASYTGWQGRRSEDDSSHLSLVFNQSPTIHQVPHEIIIIMISTYICRFAFFFFF